MEKYEVFDDVDYNTWSNSDGEQDESNELGVDNHQLFKGIDFSTRKDTDFDTNPEEKSELTHDNDNSMTPVIDTHPPDPSHGRIYDLVPSQFSTVETQHPNFGSSPRKNKADSTHDQIPRENPTKVSPHVCTICQKTFSRNFILVRHMLMHTGEKPFACEVCGKGFGRIDKLKLHMKSHTREKIHKCEECGKTFLLQLDLARHVITHKTYPCDICGVHFRSTSELMGHKRKAHAPKPPIQNRPIKKKKNLGVLNMFSVETFTPSDEASGDLTIFFEEIEPQLKNYLIEKMGDYGGMKWYTCTQVVMSRMSADGNEENITTHFRSNCASELNESTISNHMCKAFQKMLKSFDEFTQRGSGWVLERIENIEVSVVKYRPFRPY